MSLVDEALKKAHADLSQRTSEMIPAPVPQQMADPRPSRMPVVGLMLGAGVLAAVVCGVGFYFLQAQTPADQPTAEVAVAQPAEPSQATPAITEPVAQAAVPEPADPSPIDEAQPLAEVEPPPTEDIPAEAPDVVIADAESPADAAIEPPPTEEMLADAPDAVVADSDSPVGAAPEPTVAALTNSETDPAAHTAVELVSAEEIPLQIPAPSTIAVSTDQAIGADLDIVVAATLALDALPPPADTTAPTEAAVTMAEEADAGQTMPPLAATTDASSGPVASNRRRFEMPDGTTLELNAIVWSETRPVALINGSPLMVGDSADAGAVVASIEPRRVKIRTADNQHFYLRPK